MTIQKTHAESLFKYAPVSWIIGVALLLFSEVLLFYIQHYKFSYSLSSPLFWFVPILISTPTSSGVTLYRQFANSHKEIKDITTKRGLAYCASNMILVANATLATLLVIVMMKFFHS